MASATQIRSGFHFNPTEEELIHFLSDFLEMKKRRLPDACPDNIVEKELYGKNATPWEILTEDQPWIDCNDPKKKKMMIFVFTKLLKVENSEKKISRVAGCGTWHGKSVPKEVENSERQIIGKKRTLTFKPKKEHEWRIIENGHWIMHEISMVGEYNYVICRITKELSKNKEEETIKLESYKKRNPVEKDSSHGKRPCMDGSSDVINNPLVQQEALINNPSPQQEFLSILFDDHQVVDPNSSVILYERFNTILDDFKRAL